MKLQHAMLAISTAAALLVSTTARAEGDPARGKARSQACEGCHGITDYRTAYPGVYSVPKIGRQQAEYIVKALQEYKTGTRKHPSMRAIAAGLSADDMADLAAYYASDTTGK